MTGNGHITRSIQMINSLKSEGFEVDIVTSGNNSQLKLPFEVKHRFKGLSFFYDRKGGINWIKTLLSINAKEFFKESIDLSSYDLVISDFEPVSARCAKKQNIKSIGLSNQYSFYSKKMKRPFIKNIFSELFIKYFAKCDEHIGIGYDKFDNFIVLPIVNSDLLNKTNIDSNFYLIYLPSISSDTLIKEISKINSYNWKIYSPDIIENHKHNNIELKKLDKKEFTNDLLSCSGVITASGFSTTSEALVLNKKLWSIPIKGQYEQKCNAEFLKSLGIFTKSFNSNNINKWLNNFNTIQYQWEDPTTEIIKKIKQYAEN